MKILPAQEEFGLRPNNDSWLQNGGWHEYSATQQGRRAEQPLASEI
jgi:hypothetical protein